MSSESLTCRELVELVTEYLEDTLSPPDRERFAEHIMGCAPCRAYLEQMRQTIRLLGAIPPESVSAEAEETLVSALREWKRADRRQGGP